MHGDLHARNVRVHKQNAILIDFYATDVGPLAMDPASLEISIVFDGFAHENPSSGGAGAVRFSPAADWRIFVDRLYDVNLLKVPPPPASRPAPREWLWNVVRQIRLMALASTCHEDEYRTAVALQLLRHACHNSRDDGDEIRRAYAYVVADRLLP